jgi:CubicO group peptidase (beta-lactamase class C family)
MKTSVLWLIILLVFLLTLPGRAAHPATEAGLQLGEFLTNWLVLKPIPVTAERNTTPDEVARKQAFAQDWLLDKGGEARIQPHAGMKVEIAGHALKWQPLESKNGIAEVSVNGHPMDYAIAYAWTEFNVSEKKTVFLGIGSDDGVKVWLNGKLVHEHWVSRPVRIDDDLAPVELQPGKNQLLLKVQNDVGPWGFACRVLSEDEAQGLKMVRANIEDPGSNALTDAEIRTMLRDNVDTDKEAVGLVVGSVDEHGTRVVSYGKLDNGTSTDVDGDTLFEIGSITKVFTALLLQDMVERGEMKLDDPVQKYLPESVRMQTYQGKQITLLHLATHTSGLPREVDNLSPRSWRNPGAGYTVGQLYAFLSHCKLRHAPGTRQEYSNLGLELLGHVIALKAGKDYETLVVERICRPLGMDSTRVTLTPELKSRLAIGHAMPGRPVLGTDLSSFPGAGGLRSTANDLLKFVSAYMGLTPSPLNPLMQKAEAFHSLESGAKLRLAWWGDGTVFEHGGLTFGFKTELAFDSKKRRGIVVLSNCANSRFFPAVMENWHLLGRRSPLPKRTVPVDTALFDRYVGQYQTDNREICTVRRESERLMVQWIGHSDKRMAGFPSFEVFPQSETVFYNEFFERQVMFLPATNDQAIKLILTGGPQHPIEMTRISTGLPELPAPIRIDSKLYDGYVGQYRHAFFFGLFHIGPVFNIRHETDELGDHLVGYISGNHIEIYVPALSRYLLGGEIFPESETTFFSPLLADDLRITFIGNKKGKTTGIIVHLNGADIRGVRISNRPAT